MAFHASHDVGAMRRCCRCGAHEGWPLAEATCHSYTTDEEVTRERREQLAEYHATPEGRAACVRAAQERHKAWVQSSVKAQALEVARIRSAEKRLAETVAWVAAREMQS